MMIFDDVGSYPLPAGVSRKWVEESLAKNPDDERLRKVVEDAFRQKIKAGVELPNYPQFQNMISQFLTPIMDNSRWETPMLMREGEAKIPEVELLAGVAAELGKRLKLRLCVTGPIELYYYKFGASLYMDVLLNIAESLNRFIKWGVERAAALNMEVKAVSLDEPSLGLNPKIREEGISEALEAASKFAHSHKIDVQLHLHSPLFYKHVLSIEGVSVIGVESAANPSYLDLIDRRDLERHDKFLRVGVARTDILNMAAEYNEQHDTNVFKEPDGLTKVVDLYNSPEEVKARLKKAHSVFGDIIKYVGPDCGLGTFPSQEVAFLLLKNTAKGLKLFRDEL